MLPHGFERPGAAAAADCGCAGLLCGSPVLRRLVLGLYGFLIGAMVASSIVGVSEQHGHADRRARWRRSSAPSCWSSRGFRRCVSLVGGHLACCSRTVRPRFRGTGDPSSVLVVAAAVVGAIAALFVQRWLSSSSACVQVRDDRPSPSRASSEGPCAAHPRLKSGFYPTSSLVSRAPPRRWALASSARFVQSLWRGGKRRLGIQSCPVRSGRAPVDPRACRNRDGPRSRDGPRRSRRRRCRDCSHYQRARFHRPLHREDARRHRAVRVTTTNPLRVRIDEVRT